MKFGKMLEMFSEVVADAMIALAPVAAPIPTAVQTAMAMLESGAHPLAAYTGAFTVEAVGFSAIHTALRFRDYNLNRRTEKVRGKGGETITRFVESEAPTRIAIAITAVYFAATIALVLMVEVLPQFQSLYPVVFPVFGISAFVTSALNSGHKSRVLKNEEAEAERHEKRSAAAKAAAETRKANKVAETVAAPAAVAVAPARQRPMRASAIARRDEIMSLIANEAYAPTAWAEKMNISRQTIYNILAELESSGKIYMNGDGAYHIAESEKVSV